ncbi:MAG: ABC transporter permease [Thermodesulfobacteriota bacterium]
MTVPKAVPGKTKPASNPRRRFSLPGLADLAGRNRLGLLGLAIIVLFVTAGLLAPVLAPFGPLEKGYNQAGKLERLEPPSWKHPCGTTLYGRDVFSQLLFGARTVLLVSFLTAFFVALIGLNVGLCAGYFGGWVDNLLMRITDVLFGVPVLPFAIVALSLLTRGLWGIILVMSSLYWMSTARVVRSQVLSLRERTYMDAARISGAGDLNIIYKHLAPNVLPQVFVHGAFAVAWAITTEASISFLGFGDPNTISWGAILHDVFSSNVMYLAWWWFLPPGLCIILLVLALYLTGRAVEETVNPRLRDEQ